MRILIFIGALCILGMLGLTTVAVSQFESVANVMVVNERLRLENQQLEGDMNELKSDVYGEPLQVKFAADALSEFYMRVMEAGEVLGAGVRIAPAGSSGTTGTPQFATIKYGVQVAPVVVDAAAPASAAPALFALLWEELDAMPVSVKKITAHPRSGVVALQLEVDIFGR